MSPIYAVFRSGEMSLRVKKARLLEDGEHIISHNNLSVPITVEGNRLTVHIGQAEGDLVNGHINGCEESIHFGERGIVTDISMILPSFEHTPHSSIKSALVIHGNYETYEPHLYIERHERAVSKNFPSSSSKERE